MPANPILDFESAPVRPEGLPTAHQLHQQDGVSGYQDNQYDEKLDEKAMNEVHDATVVPAYEEDEDYEGKPTEEELRTLRKIGAPLPFAASAMCLVELAERASYYGCTQVFGNFVRGSLPVDGPGTGAVSKGPLGPNQTAGALGLGGQTATAVTQSFTFLAYIIPIFGGIIADTKWGRFKTICVGTLIGAIAHILLVIPAIPKVIASGNALAPFLISIYILSFASGFIKPALAPMLCDQSPVKRNTITTLKSGERVILSPQVTVQRYLLIFYWCINIGAFFGLATSYCAHDIGFWLAFLTPGIFYMLMPIVLFFCYKRLIKFPPTGSIVIEAIRAVKTLFRDGNGRNAFKRGNSFWDNARPSAIAARGGDLSGITWDDKFIADLKNTFDACKVFCSIPIFNLADGGLGNSENSMSAAMTLGNVPNDLISNMNPLAIVIFTPIINYGLYPMFAKMGWPISPMWRMTIGFTLGGLNMFYGAVLQMRVYATSPCGNFATSADCIDAGLVSPISLWLQVPLYVLPAIGEIFVNVTSYELAYTRAPPRMKGLVYSFALFTTAISSAIGLACSAVVVDPHLVVSYWVLGAACMICAAIFPFLFKNLDKEVQFYDPTLLSTAENTKDEEAKRE